MLEGPSKTGLGFIWEGPSTRGEANDNACERVKRLMKILKGLLRILKRLMKFSKMSRSLNLR